MGRTRPRRIVRPVRIALLLALLCGGEWWAKAQGEDDDRSYTVTIASPDEPELAGPLRDASTLQQFSEQGGVPPPILIRRALTDRSRLAAVLRSEGHFEGSIRIELAGVEATDPTVDARLAAFPPDAPIPVTVTAEPGPRIRFGPGTLASADGAPLSDTIRAAFAFPTDAPARGADVLAAEARALDALRAEGHAFARFVSRDALVDHDQGRMFVTTTIDPGPRVVLGRLGIEGTDRLSERAVRVRAGIEQGAVFNPAAIEAARRAVALFPSVGEVRVVLGTEPDADGTIPLTFAVTERPRRVIAFSADYSTDEGARILGEWTHRNILGQGETLGARIEVNRLLSNGTQDLGGLAAIRLSALDVWRREQTGDLEFKLERERKEAYDRDAATLVGTLARPIAPGVTVRGGLSLDASEVTDAGDTNSYVLLGVPLGIVIDRRNSILDPTSGFRAAALVTPEYPLYGDTPGFTRARFDVSALLDLTPDGGTVLAARTAVGVLFGADADQIPADRRYYAGGGGSIRGYSYQSLGPRDPSGDPIGGGSLLEFSAELRQRVAGDFGVVAFVDAGNAYESRLPEGDLRIGAGLGVRYRSPIGPIRLDLAYPFDPVGDRPSYGVEFYAGIGQAF